MTLTKIQGQIYPKCVNISVIGHISDDISPTDFILDIKIQPIIHTTQQFSFNCIQWTIFCLMSYISIFMYCDCYTYLLILINLL